MSRTGSPPSPPYFSPRLPERTGGLPARPVGSLDRISVTVHYTAWDMYRMAMAERWRRSYSADAPVLSSTFPLAVVLYLLIQLAYDIFSSSPWRNFVPGVAFWILVAWVVWWAVAPLLQARRQAEAVPSEPPVRFVFSPAGVEMIRLDVSMQIAWPGIRRVKETWFSFLIYPRQSSPCRRPRRPLDSTAPVDRTLFCASPPLLRGHRGFTSLPHLDSQSRHRRNKARYLNCWFTSLLAAAT